MSFWIKHGTKILGGLTAVVSALATTPGIIPDKLSSYVTALLTLLGAITVKRGFTNTDVLLKTYGPK